MRARLAAAALARALACALACALGAASCEVPPPAAPEVRPGLVVFSVLDPGTIEQTILVMESRATVPDLTNRTFVADDPIVSAGEKPVSGARVVLYGPAGDSAVAIEDPVRRADRLGAGVYRVWTSGNRAFAPPGAYVLLRPGERYRLRITSPIGAAEGSTRVPTVASVVTGPTRTINLFRDTVMMSSSGVAGAGFVYSLRATNGNQEGDSQFRRDLERRLILPSLGDDWAFSHVRERLRSGTRHTLTVTAADSNYFAYFGDRTDPFADRTGRTNLRGAAGVFGSLMVIYALPITVSVGM
jgi:hypothetical protein